MKKKVREFVEKHEDALAVLGYTIASITCGVYIGCLIDRRYRIGDKVFLTDGTVVKQVLVDAQTRYSNGMDAYGLTSPIRVNELGELGARMMKVGCAADKTFTNFIAIGPDKK